MDFAYGPWKNSVRACLVAANTIQVPAQQPMPHAVPAAGQPQQQPMMQGDPGRIVVQAPQRPIEPVFVAPPKQRVQRVVHSDIYLR